MIKFFLSKTRKHINNQLQPNTIFNIKQIQNNKIKQTLNS